MEECFPTTPHQYAYRLWHIPSSTVLWVTSSDDDAEQRISQTLATGVCVTDLMLDVEDEAEPFPQQFIGQHILTDFRSGSCRLDA